MNILIIDSWLRDFLKTGATAKEIGQYLSLCGQSVEKITKAGHDFIYDVEITTNRSDCFSVYGLARELNAILPRFNISSKLLPLLHNLKITTHNNNNLPLEVKITDSSLCPRFTAVIFENIKIGPSPKLVQERLVKSGIRALNNVIDISNYLMLELGQPMHTFDYDKINGGKMILRQTQKKEKITTLDGQTRILPTGTIVIEDGTGRIIDLCGIMGAENSAVDEKTKRVLLFVQTYDPAKIRRTCQLLGFRTEAASRFEKGVDPESVLSAITKAVEMFEKNCQAQVASKLIDLYPKPQKQKTVDLDLNLVNKIIGVEIPRKEITDILESLGFALTANNRSLITISVPHWRHSDIFIPEDLIEEIARIYGYQHLPSNQLPAFETEEKNEKFFWESKLRSALKYWGFSEIVSYSLVSENLLNKVNFESANYLKIANPLTEDLLYMRPSLIPSLLQVASQNQTNFSDIKIYEIANIYIPQGETNLPDEIKMLSGLQTGSGFLELKGVLETLFEDLGLDRYEFRPSLSTTGFLNPGKTAEILISGKPIGVLGEVGIKLARRFEMIKPVVFFDLELNSLVKDATQIKKYKPISSYPPIVEDLSFVIQDKIEVQKIIETIKTVDKLISGVILLDSFENSQTFRITYQSPTKTLTGEEISKIRERIIKVVKEKFGATLKGID